MNVMNNSTEGTVVLDDFSTDPLSIVFIAFGLFGIIDNGFVLVVMASAKDLRDATNLLIANQSLIDLMTSVLLLALTIEPGVLYLDRPYLARFLVCFFWISWYLFWSTITSSAINLLVVAYERFCAIVYPIRYRQRMTKKRIAMMCVIPWVYGFCTNVYILAFTRLEGNTCASNKYPSKELFQAFSFLFFSLHFLGLIITISVLYIIIALRLRRTLGEKNKTINLREQARRNVLRTMIIVFTCYVICWAPNDIFVLVSTINEEVQFAGTVYNVTILMAFGNVWINPVIYSFRYEKFQKASKMLFCCKASDPERPQISISGNSKSMPKR